MRAPVRRRFFDDLFHRNWNPPTIFLDFIAVEMESARLVAQSPLTMPMTTSIV